MLCRPLRQGLRAAVAPYAASKRPRLLGMPPSRLPPLQLIVRGFFLGGRNGDDNDDVPVGDAAPAVEGGGNDSSAVAPIPVGTGDKAPRPSPLLLVGCGPECIPIVLPATNSIFGNAPWSFPELLSLS